MNAVNNEGATPLHDAVHRGDVHIVEELVLSGANPTIKALAGWEKYWFLLPIYFARYFKEGYLKNKIKAK